MTMMKLMMCMMTMNDSHGNNDTDNDREDNDCCLFDGMSMVGVANIRIQLLYHR